MARALWFAAVLGAALGVAGAVLAHGPTVSITRVRLEPSTLEVRVGETVHFHNQDRFKALTPVSDDESFEIPTLPRGGGFHYTFDSAGDYEYHLRESPGTRGRIVVRTAEAP